MINLNIHEEIAEKWWETDERELSDDKASNFNEKLMKASRHNPEQLIDKYDKLKHTGRNSRKNDDTHAGVWNVIGFLSYHVHRGLSEL